MVKRVGRTGAMLTSFALAASLLPMLATAQAGGAAPGTMRLPDAAKTVGVGVAPQHARQGVLDSQLSTLASIALHSGLDWRTVATHSGLRVAKNQVQVEIRTSNPSGLGASLARLGGRLSGTSDGQALAQAWVPAGVLNDVANLPGVEAVRAPARFVNASYQSMTDINGATWHDAGYGGQGVKVGIIDLGFSGYKALEWSEYSGDNLVAVKNFVDGETDEEVDGGTEHGTACLEIIADVANNASLYLAKIDTRVDLEEAVAWFISNNVDIISTSFSAENTGPGDGTGWFENVVAVARTAGILWFTAAGNSREQHWGGATSIDNSGFQRFAVGQNVNWFGPGDGSAYVIPAGETLNVSLRWSDWTAPVDQDYDVVLLRWNGSDWDTLATQVGGADNQDGETGDEPTEVAFGVTTGADTVYAFAIWRYAGAQSVNLEAFANLEIDRQVFDRSVVSTALASSVVAVGAVSQLGARYTQEPFSGQGPANGPGGAASGGAVKPDIASYDGVSTATYGYYNFYGTSASTPQVAGAAAVLLSAHSDWTPDQIEQYLIAHVQDLGATGADNQFGAGTAFLGVPPGGTDTAAPIVSVPNVVFTSGATVAKTRKPINLTYRFTFGDASALASTKLQQRAGTGTWTNIALATSKTMVVTKNLKPAATIRMLRSMANDTAGYSSGWQHGDSWRLSAYQDGSSSIYKTGIWKSVTSSNYYGGKAQYAVAAGASQNFSGEMTDAAVVLTRGPNMGIVDIYVDGEARWTLDLYSATASYRKVVWTIDFNELDPDSHVISVVATGLKNPASSGTRVDFDALLIVSPASL